MSHNETADRRKTAERPIFVTGATGFIGSHLVRRLLRGGHRVAIVIRPDSDTKRIKDVLPSAIVHYADIADQGQIETAVRAINPRGIFHLAAVLVQSGIGATPEELIRANALGTVRLLQALEGVDYRFFIHAGTSLEYGTHNEPLREADSCAPTEVYPLTKLLATLYCRSIASASGRPIVMFRVFSAYGTDMKAGKLMDVVVRHALRNEDIRLTNPSVSRDFVFIDDVVELFLEAMGKAHTMKGEIFNVASGKAQPLADLMKLVLAVTRSKSKIVWSGTKDVSYDEGCQQANMAKTFGAFSWRPKTDLEAGIKKMITAIEGKTLP